MRYADGDVLGSPGGYYVVAERHRYDFHEPARIPRGLPVASRDPMGAEATIDYDIFDLLPAHLPRLFNVGRLDAQSEGLLVLTNDGDLAQRLTHPRYKVEKEYEVVLDRPWDPELARKLLRGVMLDGHRAKLERIHPVKPMLLRVVLRQGINRQIRRMFYEIGYEVKRLVRTRIGNLRLGDLPRGHWRPLSAGELKSLDPVPSSRVRAT